MIINSVSDFRRAVRNGPYAWPGGYPLYWIMADGAAVAFDVARPGWECRAMLQAIAGNEPNDQWRPVALEVNWEDANLHCDHTGERIPAAYGDDE